MPNENKEINELKYEGLAALIQGNHEAINKRLDDFYKFTETEFAHLHAHNKKQNGSLTTALEHIDKLEHAEATHYINCPVNPRVRTLEEDNMMKKSIQRWIVRVLAITISVLTVIGLLYKFFVEPLIMVIQTV